MPRPIEESKFRRFMMQGIMWVILGATIGVAALVDQSKQRSLKVVLDAPRQLDGFSIRLPRGWDNSDAQTDESEAAVVDPDSEDVLLVSAPSSLSNLIKNFGRRGVLPGVPVPGTVSVAGEKVNIMFYQIPSGDGEPPISQLRVLRMLESGKTLTISLITSTAARRSDLKPLEHQIDVIRQVAASVKLDGSPTTEP